MTLTSTHPGSRTEASVDLKNRQEFVSAFDPNIISRIGVDIGFFRIVWQSNASTNPIKPDPLEVYSVEKTQLTPEAIEIQKRLKAKWPKILQNARKMEEDYPDPVGALTELLGNLAGDESTWREIIEEPYG
jgi:hypothetical protein